MTQSDHITIYNNGIIHIINREPFETNLDVYRRGWFIINNKSHEQHVLSNNLHSISLIESYKNKGMIYDM